MSVNKDLVFACDMCGECCRNIGQSQSYADLDRGDGICKYLNGNLCSIYNVRPLLCRVDECYEQFFAQQYSRDEYHRLNYEVCKKLKEIGSSM